MEGQGNLQSFGTTFHIQLCHSKSCKQAALSFKYAKDEDFWNQMMVLSINFDFPWWRKSALNLTSFGVKWPSSGYFPPIIVISGLPRPIGLI